MQIRYATRDVFTTTRYEGNPVAVVCVPSDKAITKEQEFAIAREFNYSETVIVYDGRLASGNDKSLNEEYKEDIGSFKIAIWTTVQEIAFAGHPTIGTAREIFSRFSGSSRLTLLTKAGPVPAVLGADGVVSLSVPHNITIHSPFPVERVRRAIKFPDGVVTAPVPIASIVNGMTAVLLNLPSVEALGQTGHDGDEGDLYKLEEIEGLKEHGGRVQTYCYVILPSENGDEDGVTHIRSRMFYRLSGEDAATGSAASALSGYLSMTSATGDLEYRYEITQGVEMGRRSVIRTRVVLMPESVEAPRRVKELFLQGSAVEVMSGLLIV